MSASPRHLDHTIGPARLHPASVRHERTVARPCTRGRHPQTTAMAEQRPPSCAFEQEVRLAVVMYGGVSLAIYMYGVALELLRLARATAPAGRPDAEGRAPALVAQPAGSEAVYRRLAQLPGGGAAAPDAPIRTRFVVDILSGTSAGGINAVCLAKALARGGSLAALERLWMEEADIAVLLHPAARPPSLLDGERMLRNLVAALDGVDGDADGTPLADELDLFVTATDIAGRPEPLPLGDAPPAERRHRHVFSFRYADPASAGDAEDDFAPRDNPLLAFAARCTSAFPLAFTPMRLEDAAWALRGREPDADRLRRLFRRWDGGDVQEDRARAFGDGGYLDNKPFSYATATLARRRADLPVVRKLIYVEPAPERAFSDAPGEPPDALENAGAALIALPHYETIREDLAAVAARNRLIERANALTRGMVRDVQSRPGRGERGEQLAPDRTAQTWRRLGLDELIAEYGAPYGAYHRLKVQALVDELGALLARLAGVGDGSGEAEALRRAVAHWADAGWAERSGGGRPTQAELLLFFDLDYRLRRHAFLARTVSDLVLSGDETRRADLLAAAEVPADVAATPAFRRGLLRARHELAAVARALRRTRRQLRDSRRSPLRRVIPALVARRGELAALAAMPRAQRDAAERALQDALAPIVRDAFAALDRRLALVFRAVSRRCRRILAPDPAPAEAGEAAARACLWHFYRHFEHHDLILFPLAYGTPIGEATAVEVVRVSPLDAPSLIDERRDARRKLAGTALHNFGGFLDAAWRRNDLLWGRLDAAERLIASTLPADSPHAAALIEEAHLGILGEWLVARGEPAAPGEGLSALLARALMAGADLDRAGAERIVAREIAGAPGGVAGLLRRCLTPEALRRHLASDYEIDRRLDPARSVPLAARAAEVMGRLLSTVGEQRRGVGPAGAWLVRGGRFLWGFVELALPGRAANRLARHWLRLLYLLELLLMVGGLLFANEMAQRLGLQALAATAAVHLALSVAGALIGRPRPPLGRRLLRAGGWLLAATAIAALALAAFGVASRLERWLGW